MVTVVVVTNNMMNRLLLLVSVVVVTIMTSYTTETFAFGVVRSTADNRMVAVVTFGSVSSSSSYSLSLLSRNDIHHHHHRPMTAPLLYNSASSSSSSSSSSSESDTNVPQQDTPTILPTFKNQDEYVQYMEQIGTLPIGFNTGTANGTFISKEAPNLGPLPIRATIIHVTNGPTNSWAAVYTKNKFPGAPIIVGKQRLLDNGPIQALVINNKVSNVCSGSNGVEDAELVCTAVAEQLQLSSSSLVVPSSTGVIGWRLPAQELATTIVPLAVQNLQSSSLSTDSKKTALDAATAICTTDRYPKIRSKTLLSNQARIVGIVKGAGMIEPNMATMLGYIMTDAVISKETLRSMLSEVVDNSFNSISVDGDESTSDTVVALSSNLVDGTDEAEFKAALLEVCQGLAADVVRNGEGTSHVMRVQITNFPGTSYEARRLGRHVVNSPLFKCAVSGNDPNTGRLAAAIGSFMGKFKNDEDVSNMSITLGGRSIFRDGKFVLEGQEVEEALSQHMADAQFDEHAVYPAHQKFVEVGIDFGHTTADGDTSSAVVYGSDLTGEYVVVNADYRS